MRAAAFPGSNPTTPRHDRAQPDWMADYICGIADDMLRDVTSVASIAT